MKALYSDLFVLPLPEHHRFPTMSGGYAPDVDAIVTIHCNTIKEAVRLSGARHQVPAAAPGAVTAPAIR